MIVGTEWMVEAWGCDPTRLADEAVFRAIFSRVIEDLGLKTLNGPGVWHKFDGGGGVTGIVALTESHLTCHSYPEHGIATFNLYCCRARPEWDWKRDLTELLGAAEVHVRHLQRGMNPGTAQSAGGEQ